MGKDAQYQSFLALEYVEFTLYLSCGKLRFFFILEAVNELEICKSDT